MKEFLLRIVLRFWQLPLGIKRFFAPLIRSLMIIIPSPKVKSIKKDIDELSHRFGVELSKKVRNDILNSSILFGSSPHEYFLFKFLKRDVYDRANFLTDAFRIQLLKKYIGIDLFKNEIVNKYGFYLHQSDFFHRPVMLFSKATSYNEFEAFVKESGGVFCKENSGSFGHNARKINDTDESALKDIYSGLILSGTDWILEGYIVQDERMSSWNQSSVNTIRIPSYLIDNGFTVFVPFIRTGRKGAEVDNAGAGGIFAAIDEKTGKIITDGADESGNFYLFHPDSKITYKGWQVPEWENLLAFAAEAHSRMKHHKYIAYDFALTQDGWVLVEGNWGQYMCQQTSTQKGFKKQFINLLIS